jgi:glutamine synthetase
VSQHPTDVDGVVATLLQQGVDVVRISFADMIGIDRGRDVLLEELPAALHHGLGFCRATFHTTPQGDVVPVPGGLDAGLPDVHVMPDLTTLAPLPWAPGAAWAPGEVFDLDGSPCEDSPRHLLARVEARLAEVGLRGVVGPELEYFLLEPDATAPSGWRRYGDAPGNVYVVGAKGDPSGHLLKTLRLLRDAGLAVTAANHEFCGGQFEINLALDAADHAFRLKLIRRSPGWTGCRPRSWEKPFNGEGGSGSTCTSRSTTRSQHDRRPGRRAGLSAPHARRSPASHARRWPRCSTRRSIHKRFGPDTLAPG